MPVKKVTAKKAPVKAQKATGHVGDIVMVRTVTNYYVGRVASVTAAAITLTDVSWVQDTGRWRDCVATGAVSRVDVYPPDLSVVIFLGACVEMLPFPALITVSK